MEIKNILDSILSVKCKDDYKIYTILGIKIKTPRRKLFLDAEKSRQIQDSYDLSSLSNCENLIVFLIPKYKQINGGIMSIFSLCEATRNIAKDAVTLISTIPANLTYDKNDLFQNDEKIYRWEQIVTIPKNLKSLIIHIPEFFASKFYKQLTKSDIEFLKNIPNLHINIMNQNIELMPENASIKDLYKLSSNITQTIAHNRYATQEVCDKLQIPTHLFSVNIPLNKYKSYDFKQKEKIIALSPDYNEHRDEIVEKLKKELNDFKIITIKNLTFVQYMDLVARSFFTITFGEGFDGYFIQPHYVGGLGFAVYNDNFFPSPEWKKFANVYDSYEEMLKNIVNDMKKIYSNKDLYNNLINKCIVEQNKLYKEDGYLDNLKRFYENKYDFYPKNSEIKTKENI